MKRKSPRRLIGPFAAVVLLPLVALGSLHLWTRNGDATEISVVQAHTGDLLSAVTATGTVAAHRTVDIKYDTQSLVTGLEVQEGDHVALNQSLATMDLRLLEPALAEARQALEKDRASLALAEASLHRAQALASAQVLAKADFETAEAGYKSLLHQTEADRGVVALAEEQISRAKLRSPIHGVVIALYVHEGEMLGSAAAVAGLGPNAAVSKPTNTLMTIAEEGSLEVNADVNAVDMGGVFVGQETKFTLDAFQGRAFPGNVKSIALQPTVTNGVTTYRVILSIPHSAHDFRIGMPSTIMLFRTVAKDAVLMPSSSVLRDGNRAFVFTVATKTAQGEAPLNSAPIHAHQISLQKIEIQIVGETPSTIAVRGNLGMAKRILATADLNLPDQTSMLANLAEVGFKPNPDLSDLQFERKTVSKAQTLPAVPGPKPKGFLQRLLNP
jgi:RND family efflux transporter MFP subunit